MKRIQLTKNLYLDEYIPKELYDRFIKAPNRLIWLLDERLVKLDQYMREIFGSVTINNWFIGGNRNCSGVRLKSSYCKEFTTFSQHSFGRASDKIFKYVTAEEVIEYILEHKEEFMNRGLGGIETDVSWVHTDVRNHFVKSDLVIFSVKKK